MLKRVLGFGLGVGAATTLASSTVLAAGEPVDYEAVRKDIAALVEAEDTLGPTLVRLAWHASGTFDPKAACVGGSNGGTIRFSPEADHGANAGLGGARKKLEAIKAKYPGLSYADLYTLAGVVAIKEMAGPAVSWAPGRVDAPDGSACPPEGRLPAADNGSMPNNSKHIRAVFSRMGFSDEEMVCLLGAHSMGFCHREASGYEGPWTFSPTAFSADFFKRLLDTEWTVRKWDGPMQYQDPTGGLMMLPTDIALREDPAFRAIVEKYAKDDKLFAEDFAKAFAKLLALGVKQDNGWGFDPTKTAIGAVGGFVVASILFSLFNKKN